MASLSGCANFPALHPHLVAIKDGKCVEYNEINNTNACNFSFTVLKEWPLEHCEVFTALPPEDIAALKEYQKSQCTTQ